MTRRHPGAVSCQTNCSPKQHSLSAVLAAYSYYSASNAAYNVGTSSALNIAASIAQSSLWSGTTYDTFTLQHSSEMRRRYGRSRAGLNRFGASCDVARSLVYASNGTGGLRSSISRLHVSDVLRQVGGGLARNKVFSRSELEMVRGPGARPARLVHPQYELLEIIPSNWFRGDDDYQDTIAVKLPLEMLIPKLDVQSLRDLCEIHDLFVTSRHYRVELEDILNNHECDEETCEDSVAILRPYYGPEVKGKLDIQSLEFASREVKQFALEHLREHLTEEQASTASIGFRIKQIGFDVDMSVEPGDTLVRDIPLKVLLPRLSAAGLHTFAAHHRVRLFKRMRKDQCVEILGKHVCHCCRPLFYVLTPVGKTRRAARPRVPPSWVDDGSTPFIWDSDVTLGTEDYPPRPTTMHDIASAMKRYCRDLAPEIIEESGCCVCGQLTSITDLRKFEESTYDLSSLEEIGCTRLERVRSQETPRSFNGPVVDTQVGTICTGCHDSLKRGQRPKLALANHLWVGEVPECLKELTLAEMAMVTCVRYNRCVVRISSGHAKMTANVIAFEHPTMKIYQRLPMARGELEDVLAVLYTGTEPPSDDDLKRSPVLVRRLKVKSALEWLKVNHRDYGDLDIDYDILEGYPLNHVPVGVFYKKIDASDGNIPDAAKSVFDNTIEEGTERGACPFTVHGLTAERYASMTTTQRKLAAVQHLKNGGKLLAVGRDTAPQSIWSNPRLYPQMFPWLFPYGLGGVDSDEHAGRISRERHLRWLLMYQDKRFQRDAGFLIVAFNHQTIRQSTQGSFMMAKRKNFKNMVDAVHQLDPGVLRIISERLMNGGRSGPQTPEEQRAFRLFDQIEYVGNRVSGSMAKRKYLRGEVWSMVYFMNTPAWFITISPADNKHPLCIHWAGDNSEFKPEIKGYEERKLLITRNPVACARFFHHLVEMFIKHLCGWSDDGVRRGIFGKPAAFYGTVEQQGRMTLHLHFLLWLKGQLSLNEIREKLTEDSEFVKKVADYVESCMVGGFSTGTKDEVEARVPRDDEYENRGIHSIMHPHNASVPADYVDPTLKLPEAPPDDFCSDVELCGCENCEDCRAWYDRFKHTLDDIILRSNVHKCFDRAANEDRSPDEDKGEGSGMADPAKDAGTGVTGKVFPSKKTTLKARKTGKRKGKRHATAKGCINKHGQCTARFPRDVYMRTTVDRKSGHLNPKHTESSVNDVAPAVTVGNMCNTDARFLLSGTAVKATIGYVTDYITKGWLKTYQVFSTMYDTFTRHSSMLDDHEKEASQSAQQMILKVVNSLGSKMEIGAPMAALYLLGNPDHYASHEFVTFYWKNYVNFVQGEWKALDNFAEPDPCDPVTADERQDVGLHRQSNPAGQEPLEPEEENARDHEHAPLLDLQRELLGDDLDVLQQRPVGGVDGGGREDDTVRLTRDGHFYMAKSNSDDYRFRPTELEGVSLYEFVQCVIKHPLRSSRAPRQDVRFFPLHDDHPQSHSHVMACDADRRLTMVPNFVGPQLPRKDVGDREEYCCTMLTLFKPWRTGIDLKAADVTWEEAFNEYTFTERACQIIENFNVKHECYDARDDFSKLFQVGTNEDKSELEDNDSVFGDDVDGSDYGEEEEDLSSGVGPATQSIQDANSRMFSALRKAGWTAWDVARGSAKQSWKLPKIALDESIHSQTWRNIVKTAKDRLWRRKMMAMGTADRIGEPGNSTVRNDAYVVPSTYLSKDFEPVEKRWGDVMKDIIRDFTLNDEQEKAFRLVANHACEIAPGQLMMHLGGMAGTGKSTVIRALTAFFIARKEPYRFVLMGPTGTSAALIGGSTYHSFLGLNTGSSTRASVSTMEDVRERLIGVGYLLIDEQSMLNCRQLCAISARCCDALGVYEKPFGGLNVILCGDFAQLPPAKGYSLYSKDVSLRQSPRQTVAEQENTIGKLIWMQFTIVVILRQNMRQVDDSPDEQAFQRALLNLRWHACTDADIALFRSRLADCTDDLSLDAPGFKNVSIITARNRDKDHLNAANSARFATEGGEQLFDFYSTDSMLSVPTSRDPAKKGRVYSTVRAISKKMQSSLWQQPACTSENVAGKLSLCVGMPVLIRHNEATELCMTRGQEARIVGWSSVGVPKHPGRRSLDVLYVELINPPHAVNLPHLPKNVVPLTKISQAVDARLVNDEFVHISRSQVPVLPNFSMTDYSSQGKTRHWNVVDLTECRNFQAAYTCLSRGTKISQTLILRNFSDDKLRGDLDGALRQEYRELDYLAKITDLRYGGVLGGEYGEGTRWAVIDTYREWKKGLGKDVESAPVFDDDPATTEAKNEVICEVNTLSAQAKRKATQDVGAPMKKRKVRRQSTRSSIWESPAGPIWDSVDHSCAFDAWVFVLNALWGSDKPRWSRAMMKGGIFMKAVVDGLESMAMEDPEIEISEVRDQVRECLRSAHPRDYVAGTVGVDIITLSRHLWDEPMNKLVTATCGSCGRQDRYASVDAQGIGRYTALKDEMSIQKAIDERCQPFLVCEDCGECTYRDYEFDETLTFDVVESEGILLNSRIEVAECGAYRLAGVVYYEGTKSHFMSRSVSIDNKVYSHDGMRGGYSDYDGVLDLSLAPVTMGELCGAKASLAVYARVNRRPGKQ